MKQTQQWKLYRFNGEEDFLVGKFDTKNEAIQEAKARNRINDEDEPIFTYYSRWTVWSNDPMNEDWQITQGELPSMEVSN